MICACLCSVFAKNISQELFQEEEADVTAVLERFLLSNLLSFFTPNYGQRQSTTVHDV